MNNEFLIYFSAITVVQISVFNMISSQNHHFNDISTKDEKKKLKRRRSSILREVSNLRNEYKRACRKLELAARRTKIANKQVAEISEKFGRERKLKKKLEKDLDREVKTTKQIQHEFDNIMNHNKKIESQLANLSQVVQELSYDQTQKIRMLKAKDNEVRHLKDDLMFANSLHHFAIPSM